MTVAVYRGVQMAFGGGDINAFDAMSEVEEEIGFHAEKYASMHRPRDNNIPT